MKLLNEHLALDIPQARRFLSILAADSLTTFQTFAEGGTSPSRSLNKVMHGAIDNVASDLEILNNKGAGLFVMVNRGDGTGRKATNVQSVRALFLDLDGAPLDPVMTTAIQKGLEPHVVVQSSPGKWHVYWRVEDCTLDEFKTMQRALATRFNGDPVVNDLSRVMRLPGSWHRKQAAVQSKLLLARESQPPYRIAALSAAFGVVGKPRIRKSSVVGDPIAKVVDLPVPTEEHTSSRKMTSVGGAGVLPAAEGERNALVFQLARQLRATMPNASMDELRPVVQQWHESALPVIRTKDFAVTWEDFHRAWQKVRVPAGSYMADAVRDLHVDPLPDGIKSLGFGRQAMQLVRLCKRLDANQHERFDGAPFFLSARQAGEAIGIHYSDASKILGALVREGVLELVSLGSGKLASRYRFAWAPRHNQREPDP